MKYRLRCLHILNKLDYISWICDARTITAFVLLAIFLTENTSNLVPYAQGFGLKFSPFLFPFVTSTRIVRLFLYLVLVFLICDVGKPKEIDMFVQLRVSPGLIDAGRVVALMARILTFWLFVLCYPILCYLPHIEVTNRWGAVLGNIARNEKYEILGEFAIRVSAKIVDTYTPVLAHCLLAVTCVLSSCLLGLIILIFQKSTHVEWGILLAGVFVLLDFWVETDIIALSAFLPFSFCTYSNLNYLASQSSRGKIGIVQCILFLLLGTLLLLVLYLRSSKIATRQTRRESHDKN